MNKPVAWYDSEEYGSIRWASEWALSEGTPLYTHSVINNGGNLEELNTKVQDASTSLESTPPINAKPVAWMFTLPDGTHDWILDGNGCEGYIPLYTHPVKEQELLDEIAQLKHINRNWQISENILLLELEKLQMRELTDEEIEELIWNTTDMKDFAKAILRKANEK